MHRSLTLGRFSVAALFAVAAIISVLLLANAQIVSAASSLFGDAQTVSSGGNTGAYVQAESDATAPGYGGISFTVPGGTTVNDIDTLSTDYKTIAGDCGGGAPRFSVELSSGKNIFVYLGTAPNFNGCSANWTSTGNLLSDADLRVDTSQLAGGTFYDTWAHAKTLAGATTVNGIDLVVDAGWAVQGGQQFGFDNVNIDGTTYDFTPAPVNVTIVKYVNEVHATAGNANSATFPMQATYDFTNDQFPSGIAGSDPYDIGPTGNNTPDAYEAKSLQFYPGADYSTYERTDTSVVGATCADGKPFALNGYSYGDSLAAAQGAATSSVAPAFVDMTSNKYVIVHNKTCAAPPAPMVKVTIDKFINGQMATSGSANSASFPMQSSWNAANLGGAGSGSYDLSTAGYNSANAYEAVTSDMTSGSSYSTNEVVGGSVVGATCADGKPFALNGYSYGDSLAVAQGAATSSMAPALTNITTNKYIIVWNKTCAPVPPVNPGPPANACATPGVAPQGYTLRNGTSGSDSVNLAPNTMFVGKGGSDSVTGGNGSYIICTGSGNDSITVGNGQSVIDAGGGNNSVTAGDGGQRVTTGSGSDVITTGNGNDTIDAGGGNNTISSKGGNDSITAGSGNDIVNAGAGTDTCSLAGGTNSKSGCEL